MLGLSWSKEKRSHSDPSFEAASTGRRAKEGSIVRPRTLEPISKPRWPRREVKVDKLSAGIVTGLWAAVAQAWVGVSPPSAYGICFVSHPSDLLDWIVNFLFGTTLYVHQPSVDIPVLTVIGVIIGASVATYQHREFSFRRPRRRLSPAIYGFMVAVFGLTLGYCSVHIIMGLAYGSVIALVGFSGMMVGVILAANYVKWSVRT